MIDDCVKEHLHGDLREVREVVLRKLDGLSEYDVRRPLTPTGTNLLGLVKHLAVTESRYFGEVFGRPSPEAVPRWDDLERRGTDLWATEHETREEIAGRYRRAWAHSDATVAALAADAPGHVPWWPRPDVTLFAVLVHVLTETTRHAGHADVLREQLDGAVEFDPANAIRRSRDTAFWEKRYAEIERAATAADRTAPATARPSAAGDGPAVGGTAEGPRNDL